MSDGIIHRVSLAAALAFGSASCSREYCADLERVRIYQVGTFATGVQFPDGTRLLRDGVLFGSVGDEFSARKCSSRTSPFPEYWR